MSKTLPEVVSVDTDMKTMLPLDQTGVELRERMTMVLKDGRGMSQRNRGVPIPMTVYNILHSRWGRKILLKGGKCCISKVCSVLKRETLLG